MGPNTYKHSLLTTSSALPVVPIYFPTNCVLEFWYLSAMLTLVIVRLDDFFVSDEYEVMFHRGET